MYIHKQVYIVENDTCWNCWGNENLVIKALVKKISDCKLLQVCYDLNVLLGLEVFLKYQKKKNYHYSKTFMKFYFKV